MKKILLLFIILGQTIIAISQIVNIEDRRAVEADTNGWFGRVDLGFSMVKNTSEIFTVSGRTQLEYQHDKHYVLNMFSYDLVKAAETDFINNGFVHLRYNYQLTKKWTYEAFGQAQYNEKINLRFRGLLGTGMRYQIIDIRDQQIYYGLAYMFEYNEETEPDRIFRDHRISTYLSGLFPISKNITLSGTTYYQPAMNNLDDWRLSSQSRLVFTISTKLKFTTSFRITYDSRVPSDTPHTIYSFVNGLRLDF